MHFWIALHHPYHFFGEANSSSSSDPDARVVCHLLLTVINFRTRQEAAPQSSPGFSYYKIEEKAAKITQIDRQNKKEKAVDNQLKKWKSSWNCTHFSLMRIWKCVLWKQLPCFSKNTFHFYYCIRVFFPWDLAAYDRYLSHPYKFSEGKTWLHLLPLSRGFFQRKNFSKLDKLIENMSLPSVAF